MKKIKAYEAGDGSLHKTRESAATRNIEWLLEEADVQTQPTEVIASWIVANRQRFISELAAVDHIEAAPKRGKD